MKNQDENTKVLNEGYQGGREIIANDGYPFRRGHQGSPTTNEGKTPPPPPKRQPKDGDK